MNKKEPKLQYFTDAVATGPAAENDNTRHSDSDNPIICEEEEGVFLPPMPFSALAEEEAADDASAADILSPVTELACSAPYKNACA